MQASLKIKITGKQLPTDEVNMKVKKFAESSKDNPRPGSPELTTTAENIEKSKT